MMHKQSIFQARAVARSENPGGLVVLGGDNVPPLVEIGLIDLLKYGGRAVSDRPDANYRSDLIIALSWLTRVIRHP